MSSLAVLGICCDRFIHYKILKFQNDYRKDYHSLEVGCVMLFLRGQEERELVLCFPRIYKGDVGDRNAWWGGWPYKVPSSPGGE